MDVDDGHASVIPPSPLDRVARRDVGYRQSPPTGADTRVVARTLVPIALLAAARVAAAAPTAGVGPDARDRPLQLLGLLLGVCTLLTLTWWWRRPALPPDLQQLPEPGTLGPDTPPPTAALAVYRAGPAERAALLDRLLVGLGRNHPVLLAAPPSLQPGPVFGGPVFRARAPTPAAVRRDLRALRRGGHRRPVVLLVTDDADPELLDRFRLALPDSVGLSVLATAAPTADPG